MAIITIYLALLRGFTGGSDSKESACNAGDPGQEDPLEKEMATHASTLAWRIPRTEEPGVLQSMDTTEQLTHIYTKKKKIIRVYLIFKFN